jgi:hypothetical protein
LKNKFVWASQGVNFWYDAGVKGSFFLIIKKNEGAFLLRKLSKSISLNIIS